MYGLEYYIYKNIDNFNKNIITYREYLQEKKSLLISYKISIKNYNNIENKYNK